MRPRQLRHTVCEHGSNFGLCSCDREGGGVRVTFTFDVDFTSSDVGGDEIQMALFSKYGENWKTS